VSFFPLIPTIPDDISVVFIVGATASGKSDFALALAEKYNGIIINGDALQIYHELSIITARPTDNDITKIPHYLYGFLSITDTYNVADWCCAVQNLIETHTNKKIFIVGGTGLYFKSFINGIAKIPDIPDNIRKTARSLSNQELYDALVMLDPIAVKKLHINDTQRLARAYEVVVYTGQSLYAFHQNQEMLPFLPQGIKTQGYFLNPPRDILYNRINQRFDMMIHSGVLEEIKAIMHHDTHTQAMKAVGVPEVLAYLNNECSLDEAVAQAKQASRHYAKRQITFFNNQFLDFEKII
jgi:tRNA dimethylallyltransferase